MSRQILVTFRICLLEVAGPASNLVQAKSLFLGVATTFSAMVSFLASGYVDTPLPNVFYATTGDKKSHDFLQVQIPVAHSQLEQAARPINIDLVSSALSKLGQSDDFKRLLRAIAQYHQMQINTQSHRLLLPCSSLYLRVKINNGFV